MKLSILSWTLGAEGGNARHPDWRAVAEKLMSLETGAGTTTLDSEGEDGFRKSLQVRFENGRYVLTFGHETETDWVVRMHQGARTSAGEEVLLGDVWRSHFICRDPEVIRLAFRQFFDSGACPTVGEWC